MKIVILDSYALNPGDLSWDGIRSLGEVTIYEDTGKDEVIERSKDADALIINKIVLGKREFDELPKLKYVGISATGYNIVDIEEARKHGVVVTNVPAYSTDSVAEFVFALLFEHAHHIGEHSESVRNGDWKRSRTFCYWNSPQLELSGKTFAVVGLGNIGFKVARLAEAFDMKVIYNSRQEKEEARFRGWEYIENRQELFRRADIISLHTALTPDTEKMINKESLSVMKRNAILINTARGGLIDEKALYDALKHNRIAASLMDVMTNEPERSDNPLFKLPNCIVTPHIAWASQEARERNMVILEDNLKAFMNGRDLNRVL